MRRRVRPGPPVDGVPERLARFRVEDWLDQVGPPPAWWDDPPESWAPFKARILHMRAVRAWRDEHVVSREQWAALLGGMQDPSA